jgi:hypothetical protein
MQPFRLKVMGWLRLVQLFLRTPSRIDPSDIRLRLLRLVCRQATILFFQVQP